MEVKAKTSSEAFPGQRRKVENIIERHVRQGIREVGETESKEILEAYGFMTPKGSDSHDSRPGGQYCRAIGISRSAENMVT